MKSPSELLYAEYLEIQKQHLAWWEPRLMPRLFADVRAFVLSQNRSVEQLPTTTFSPKHRVYRGQDLIQIIMEWPDLSEAYRQKDGVRVDPEGVVHIVGTVMVPDAADDCL